MGQVPRRIYCRQATSGSIEVDTQPGEFTEISRIILPRTAAFVAEPQLSTARGQREGFRPPSADIGKRHLMQRDTATREFRAKQFIDVALTVADMDAASRIVEKFGGLF
jgi:hypothetical protein